MSRFVKNKAGGTAFKLSPELELYSRAVTSTLHDKYYEDGERGILEIRSLIRRVKPEFVAKLAVYTREEMHMRTLPLVLAVELAKVHNGDSLVGKTVQRIVQRPDELVELLGYYEQANKRNPEKFAKRLNKLSHQVVKGLKGAFGKFDEYQLGKYDRAKEIKLRDVVFLTHPKYDKADKDALSTKVIEDRLETPYTWETELSKLGQQTFATEADKQKAFKEKWEELILAKEENGHPMLGYMALLRNLRNMLDAEISQPHVFMVAERLADKAEVARSKQFPFRFLSASREIEMHANKSAQKFVEALDKALLASAENIRGFDYDTGVVIASDVSGSMNTKLNEKSKVQYKDIGLVLSVLLNSKCENAVIGMFGDIWMPVADVPQDSVLKGLKKLEKSENLVGWSTNGRLVIEDLIKRKVVADKVMLFTDCELYNSGAYGTPIHTLWKQYRNEVNPNARIYLFNLSGYGTTPLEVKDSEGAYLISGWSDKVFDVLAALEDGAGAVDHIEKVVL